MYAQNTQWGVPKEPRCVEFPPEAKPSYIDGVDALWDILTTFPTVLFAALSTVSLLY
jgi:hypothetical protein